MKLGYRADGTMTGDGKICKKSTGNVLLVGVQLSSISQELLTWTLTKFTKPGDVVIALHVAASPSEADTLRSKSDGANQKVDSLFDSVIGVYEGFCSIKQIGLQVKITSGSSLRKVLIEEAKNYNATKLILGTTSKHLTLGSSYSLAKDCAKQLPLTCSVVVIQHGRIVFEKEGALTYLRDNSGVFNRIQRTMRSHSCSRPGGHAGKRNGVLERPSDEAAFFEYECGAFDDASYNRPLPTRFMKSPVSVLHAYKYVPPPLQGLQRSCDLAHSNATLNSQLRVESQENTHTLDTDKAGCNIESSRYSCVLSRESSGQKKAYQECAQAQCKSDSERSVNLGQEMLAEGSSPCLYSQQSKCTTISARDTSNDSASPGWPLRSISMTKLHNAPTKGRRISVVEWALQLPDRPREVLKVSTDPANDDQSISTPMVNNKEMFHNISGEGEQHIAGENSRQIISAKCNTKCQLLGSKSTIAKSDAVCQDKFCLAFQYAELQAATNNFSTGNLIGKGGCSQVYQGVLSNGRKVAVKCLKASASDSEQEFLTEVEIISGLHHCHIVQLIGYCVDSQCYLLVYNLAPEGSLEQKLHAGKGKAVLPWDTRYKVAVGVAEALNYLHDGCARPIIHRDVKCSNILLSSDHEPQLTDFGLAKWVPVTSSHITCSDVVGTFGYLAPEYFMYGKVNEKTDVYSFGVVLLELITGKHPIDTAKPNGHENLLVWARPLLEDESSSDQLIDPKLEGAYNAGQLKNMIIAAALCLRQSPHSRPRMSRILKLLIGEGTELEHSLRQEPVCKEIDDGYDVPNYGDCDIRSHLALALLGVDDDVASQVSIDHSVKFAHSNKFLEEYLGGRYSRSSSFD